MFVVCLFVSLVKHYAYYQFFFLSYYLYSNSSVSSVHYFSLLSCLALISVALAPLLLLTPLALLYGLSSLWFNGSLIIQTLLWSEIPLVPQQTSRPTAMPAPSNNSAPPESFIPPAAQSSSFPPASPCPAHLPSPLGRLVHWYHTASPTLWLHQGITLCHSF